MKRFVAELYGSQGQFDGKFRTVGTPRLGLAVLAQNAGGLGLLLNSEIDVGYKVRGWTIDQCLGLVTKQPGGRMVGHFNPAMFTDYDDRVEAAFEYGGHQAVGATKFSGAFDGKIGLALELQILNSRDVPGQGGSTVVPPVCWFEDHQRTKLEMVEKGEDLF